MSLMNIRKLKSKQQEYSTFILKQDVLIVKKCEREAFVMSWLSS